MKEAHKHEHFGRVALGTTPGLSQGKLSLSLGLHTGSPIC